MCCWCWVLECIWKDKDIRNICILGLLTILFIGVAVFVTSTLVPPCCCFDPNRKTSSCPDCDFCGLDEAPGEFKDDLYCQDGHDWSFTCHSPAEAAAFGVLLVLGCITLSVGSLISHRRFGNSSSANGRRGDSGGDAGGNDCD